MGAMAPGTPRAALAAVVVAAWLLASGCETPPDERRGEIYRLQEEGTAEARDAIRGRLGDPDPDVRATALFSLLLAHDDDSLEFARQAFADTDPFVRRTAADGLGRAGQRQGIPLLSEALLSDGDPLVRRAAATALVELDDPTGRTALARALLDPDASVRVVAIRGIGRLGAEPHLPTLIRILEEDPDWELRAEAAGVLAQLSDADVASALERAESQDESPFVRAAARKALAAVNGDEASR